MSKVGVVAKITAQEGQRDALAAVMQQAIDIAQGEEGTLLYLLHADAAAPDVLWMYELYASKEALDAHSTSDAFKALYPAIAPYIAGRPELHFCTPLAGKGL